MKIIAFLSLAAVAAPALAASPFDGTWKTDLASAKLAARPDVLLLQAGRYSCKSCTPPYTVPADGGFHPVAGHDYYDAAAVKVVDAHTVEMTGRKGGKPVFTNTLSVSADGKTLTSTGRRVNAVTGVASSESSTATRVGPAPAAAHPVSGSWRAAAILTASDTGSLQTFKVAGDTLTFSLPTGEGYTATFGGPAVLQKNDPGRTMVSLKKLADNHIVETDARAGKPIQSYDMKVAPDGRTMTMAITDLRTHATDVLTLRKQ